MRIGACDSLKEIPLARQLTEMNFVTVFKIFNNHKRSSQ